MLENYIENFDERKFVRDFQISQKTTRSEAMKLLRRKIKDESYYQKKIKDALSRRYPSAYIVKIAQGSYSTAGIPDLMMIYQGHYFGFEVKRPIFGTEQKLQKETIRRIINAGGTADFVRWPEEAIRIIEETLDHIYDEEQA